MKKLLLIISVFTMVIAANSQNILIKDYSGNDYTNKTYVHIGTKGEQEASFEVMMDPSVTGDKYIALKRYEKSVCPTTLNFFCWTLCYGAKVAGDSPLWEDGPIKIEEDSVFNDFHAYYDHDGVGTDGEFLYVMYDTSNTVDSSWVIILFDYGTPSCDTQGIGFEEKNNANNISIFPNPANDFFVVSNTQSNDEIEVLDILGKSVYRSSNPTAFHRLNKLDQGIYLVRVRREGKVIFTEKLIRN